VADSQGVPWSGAFVNANGDPTVDLRSDIAAESRAKIGHDARAVETSLPLPYHLNPTFTENSSVVLSGS